MPNMDRDDSRKLQAVRKFEIDIVHLILCLTLIQSPKQTPRVEDVNKMGIMMQQMDLDPSSKSYQRQIQHKLESLDVMINNDESSYG
jgi:hypothetical protein